MSNTAQIVNTTNDEEIGESKNVYVSIPFRNIRTAPSYECIELGQDRKLLEGYVYVLSNECMPGIYKIGMSKNHPSKRAKDISHGTGVPASFKVETYFHVKNMAKAESEVHEHLAEYRVNQKREFFKCSLEQIFSAVQEVASFITADNKDEVFFARNIVCVGEGKKKTRSIKVSQDCFDLLEMEACDSIDQLAESLILLMLQNVSCGISIIDGKLVAFPSSEYGADNESTPEQHKPKIIKTKPLALNLKGAK